MKRVVLTLVLFCLVCIKLQAASTDTVKQPGISNVPVQPVQPQIVVNVKPEITLTAPYPIYSGDKLIGTLMPSRKFVLPTVNKSIATMESGAFDAIEIFIIGSYNLQNQLQQLGNMYNSLLEENEKLKKKK